MFAVIESGGKQHRVEPGDCLRLEKIEVGIGETIEFPKVLMVVDNNGISVGRPIISGVKVTAEIVEHGRSPKVRIIKFRRRKHHMKRMGHRQWYTEVKINLIERSEEVS